MVREPKSGLHWWTYQAADAPNEEPLAVDDYRIYFTDGKAVGVIVTSPSPRLSIREITGQVPDTRSVLKSVIDDLQAQGAAHPQGWLPAWKSVDLYRSLDRDFFYIPGDAAPPPAPTIVTVNRNGDRWRIILKGANGDLAELTLDDEYRVLAADRLQRSP